MVRTYVRIGWRVSETMNGRGRLKFIISTTSTVDVNLWCGISLSVIAFWSKFIFFILFFSSTLYFILIPQCFEQAYPAQILHLSLADDTSEIAPILLPRCDEMRVFAYGTKWNNKELNWFHCISIPCKRQRPTIWTSITISWIFEFPDISDH